VSSNVECLTLARCKLSNDFFPTALTWFSNVKELNLPGNDFTILPECIKECHLLRNLRLDRCQYLQEVRGIPPNLEIFSAKFCISLTSTEMLLNQVFFFLIIYMRTIKLYDKILKVDIMNF
jgi:hypothetical protein